MCTQNLSHNCSILHFHVLFCGESHVRALVHDIMYATSLSLQPIYLSEYFIALHCTSLHEYWARLCTIKLKQYIVLYIMLGSLYSSIYMVCSYAIYERI